MKSNPFDVTKAVDYTDEEIYRYWVDMDGQASAKVMKPDSLMPMIIVGSKGSGKTHIMKYFSYELQKIRCKQLHTNLADEKFIGVYIRCSGFNADKFSGKGVSDDIWSILYAYYWELWIGERIVCMLQDMVANGIELNESQFVNEIYNMFLKPIHRECTLSCLRDYLIELQKNLEYQVQSFLFMDQDKPIVDILLDTKKLTYDIPTLLKNTVPFFKDKYIMYLIDELENFSEIQQQLIQSLLREKPVACTFRVGTRPYGIRTYYTLGCVEENHDGSEFEKIILDDVLRSYSMYNEYVIKICMNRLVNSDLDMPESFDFTALIENPSESGLLERIYQKKESQSRSYMYRLERRLSDILNYSDKEVKAIISNLSFKKDCIIERANIVLLYRRINRYGGGNLVKVSKDIHESALKYFKDKNVESLHSSFLDKYEQDVFDMIVKEGREDLLYTGLDKLIFLSCGTPRTLLRLLKASFSHQYFNTGLPPFEGGRILTADSQVYGIRNTAEWFFEENRIPATIQSRLVDSVMRLGNYLQALRFSDIPPQCSINIFSIPEEEMNETARNNFEKLKQYSYIIETNERRTKNKKSHTNVYGLNSILLPKWELSLAKRGLVNLSKEEADMLFDTSRVDEWDAYITKKLKNYNFPFKAIPSIQPSLFDLLGE